MERENRMAILMLGRPYHNDPGLNHAILEEFQALGYPILSMRSIPKDKAWLAKYFAEDLKKKHVTSPLDISDVWPENYSANSVQKVWAAKFAARHPNIAVLDLSSFKCGHDAPTYGLIDSVTAAGGGAYSALHDLDANRPTGSIKIRVKTYGHTLMLGQERLEDIAKKKEELAFRINQKKLALLEEAARRRGADMDLQRQIESLREQIQPILAEREAAAQQAQRLEKTRPASLAVVR
jgi:predicted nucleotide-binding protein (sugar kinase/HSP70/actin superfamily)